MAANHAGTAREQGPQQIAQGAATGQNRQVGGIDGWIESWAEYLRVVEGKAEATRRDYLASVRRLVADLGIEQPAQITREALERHLKRRSYAGAGPSRISSAIIATRLFCRYLIAHDQMASNPATMRAPRTYRKAMKVLTKAEVQRLIYGTTGGEKPVTLPKDPRELIAAVMFAVAYGGALRPNELGPIRTDDLVWIDEEWMYAVNLRRTKHAHGDVLQRIGEGASRFLGTYLELRPLLGPGPYLFPCEGARPMSANTVRRRFTELWLARGLEAKGRRVVPKILRTTRCTHLLAERKNPRVVQRFMRHNSIETTMAHYASFDDSQIARMLRDGDPLGKRERKGLRVGGTLRGLVEGLSSPGRVN